MARTFNGSNQLLEDATAPVLTSQWPLTMACWFRTTAGGALVSFGDTYTVLSGLGTLLFTTAPGAPLQFISIHGGSYRPSFSSQNIVSGQWHHACGLLWHGSYRQTVLDGIGGAYDNGVVTAFPNDYFVIGGEHRDGGYLNYFNGDIAEVSVWNVILDYGEIAALAAGYPAPFVRPQSLKCYYPMIRDSDTHHRQTYNNNKCP